VNHSLLAVARITRHGGQATDKTDEEVIHEELSAKNAIAPARAAEHDMPDLHA
jgi:hypothetical protein